MSNSQVQISSHVIGPGQPVYIIAELSANHLQSRDRARSIVNQAAACGANAIKLQTYTADTITLDCDLPHFQINHGTAWDNQRLYELYGNAYTPWEWHAELQQLAGECGLDFFSSPFDETAVDFLENLNVPCYKVASFEIVDIPLLRKIGSTLKPVIMSTGMATAGEIREAVDALRESGCSQIVLLKCTSAYPAPPQSMNLATLPELSRRFDVPVGLSDHTLDSNSAIVATALGACVIEKHLTLSRDDGGPDSHFSLEPNEFAAMVDAIRSASASLGKVHFGPTSFDEKNRDFRPSLFAVRDIEPGELFDESNVRSLRPATGLAPVCIDQLIGQVAAVKIPRGTPMSWQLIGGKRETA